MTLTLAVEGRARLDDGRPAELVIDRRTVVVGRGGGCDWSLPDPGRHLSSRHFEVRFDGAHYLLVDCSTNGTILLATGERLTGPHLVRDGDRFQAGPYVIAARLTGDAGHAADPGADWRGWDGAAAPSAADRGWDAPAAAAPTQAGSIGWDSPATGWDMATPAADRGQRWQPQVGPALATPDAHRAAAGWDASAPAASPVASGWVPHAAMAPPPTPSTWDAMPQQSAPASNWSSAAPDRAAAASPDDLWGRIAEGNVVDWARGGFGQPVEVPRDPLGLAPSDGAAALPAARPPIPQAPAAPPTPPPPPSPLRSPARDSADPAPPAADPATERLLRRLVAGLVVMMEARARAKAQLGAEATAFSPGGHNPLKFARTPDDALALLLGPPAPGFMPAEQAVEDAFRDLQSHQVATLRAMQGALRATLDRFSPTAIRARADAGGMIERIVPAARDAALWQAYTREFGGVVEGSDEAFLDIFAKEFRDAYNDQIRRAP